MKTCECGKWYNTTIKCPECNTVAAERNSYDWKNVPEDIEPYVGFVYLITNCTTGRRYIGKKLFWTFKKQKPLKGQKRRRITRVQTDWREYWSSCNELQADIAKLGKDKFTRQILSCHMVRFAWSYTEANELFKNDVLSDPGYYNQIIQCRLHVWKKPAPNEPGKGV